MPKANAHLLLIEADPDIATLLQRTLAEVGYRVRHASSTIEGLMLAREQFPHLVLLDLDLPDGHGRDVILRLRQTSEVPIIVLTARERLEEKIELLMQGADDYVVKPFALSELLARIAVQLRQEVKASYQVGALEWHPKQGMVTYQGKELLLSTKEFELLTLLMQQPGRAYRRQEIFHALWPNSPFVLGSNVMDVHLANLRAKLRQVGGYHVLRTVRGYGYALRK